MDFTAKIEAGASGWLVGQVNEFPGAMAQGKTESELKENLLDALKMILNENPGQSEINIKYQHI